MVGVVAAIPANLVVAQNAFRLRKARGWTQAEVAERMTAQTGENWDFSMVSKAEWDPAKEWDSETNRRRRYSPDELVALASVFRVPMFELFVVDDGTMVDMGGVAVRGDDFFQLVFWIPSERRSTLTTALYGGFGQEGESTYGTQHAYQWAWFRDITRVLLDRDSLSRQLLEAAAGGDESAMRQIQRLYMEHMGPELFNQVLGDERFWEQRTALTDLGGPTFESLILNDKKGDDDE